MFGCEMVTTSRSPTWDRLNRLPAGVVWSASQTSPSEECMSVPLPPETKSTPRPTKPPSGIRMELKILVAPAGSVTGVHCLPSVVSHVPTWDLVASLPST